MSIPTPNLDDRRFQDLVDQAKRRISDRCPEWTDHNVSDPGVTLIELFAQMVDETIYRLNRVPDKLQLNLMNLIGMQLQPAQAAETSLTFWLSAPARFWGRMAEDSPVLAPSGVEVSTERSATEALVRFRTTESLQLHRATLTARYTGAERPGVVDEEPVHRRAGHGAFPVFGEGRPTPGAAFFLELARPVPGCALRLDLDCDPKRGTGIIPDDPPWTWEAWCQGAWKTCEVDRDTTGGLNRSGSVYLHVPEGHGRAAFSATGGSAWLRCRLLTPREGQSFYDTSPAVGRVTAETTGVSVPASQADVLVRNEIVGVSDGTYGQPPFTLRNVPVVDDGSGGPLLFAGDDPQPWVPVTSFEHSDEHSRHYLLDRVGGQVRLGVAVRQSDGRMRRYGAVPPASVPLRLAEYRVGGGVHGNVRATALRVLKSPAPHVRAVENRHPAAGGTNPETVEQAMSRVPLFLRQRTRAVTLDDFAALAREASREVARTHALADGDPDTTMAVRVLVVPRLSEDVGLAGPIEPRELSPAPATMTAVSRYLDERRMVGIRVLVNQPRFVPIRIRARVLPEASADRRRVERASREALYRLLHPLVGGEHGGGWPFGEDVQPGDVYAALLKVRGVARVEGVTLHLSDDREVARLPIPPNGLPLSLTHAVALS